MKKLWNIPFLLLILILSACAAPAPAPATQEPAATLSAPEEVPTSAPQETAPKQPAAPSEVSFSKDLMPIFEARCINCHGGQRTSEGLDMKTYQTIIAGADGGPVVIVGDAEASSLYTQVAKGKMPKRGEKLSPEEVQMIMDWINAGAPNN